MHLRQGKSSVHGACLLAALVLLVGPAQSAAWSPSGWKPTGWKPSTWNPSSWKPSGWRPGGGGSGGGSSGGFVVVGQPGNIPNYLGRGRGAIAIGSVPVRYLIGRYEVTNAQYVVFLNVCARDADPHGLFSRRMESEPQGGITRTGASTDALGQPLPPFTYETKPNMGDKPVNFVSWLDAARYCNWLHNGGTANNTERGAYNLDGVVNTVVPRERTARRFLPNIDEWYKAAYYKGQNIANGYWSYPTKSDTAPLPVRASATGTGIQPSGARGNAANFENFAEWNGVRGNVTTIGRNGAASSYGTFDQAGNVWEIGEAWYVDNDDRRWTRDPFRIPLLGGNYGLSDDAFGAQWRVRWSATIGYEGPETGFRVAGK
jgi:sulfatase modifying factor 1